ncbi:MAG: Hpt domain-containing protein [Sulfuritalea sp.]|nr:Hpt domain-containing protein [Sulfuritalea sp.]
MTRFGFGRYRALALAIGLFLLLQVGLFALDRNISAQLRADAVYERLASRQFAVHLQVIQDSTLLLHGGALTDKQREDRIRQLDRSATHFGRTLEVFSTGGTTVGKRDIEVHVEALAIPRAQEILRTAQTAWSPVAAAIAALKAAPGPAEAAEPARVILTAVPPLRKEMVEVATLMDDVASERAATLGMAKIGALSLAAVNFFAILFYLAVYLRRSDQELERARKETADILRTTQEGLFLLDQQNRTGTQYSRALERILGTTEFSGKDFFSLLQPMVSEKTLATTREYIELLFKHDVKEKLVADLNPLNCVQVFVGQGTGRPETRYLEFGFNRVKEAGRITHLLVTANDITQRILLERSLKETEARARDQVGMLVDILQIEPAALQQFLRTAREGVQTINGLLQAQETGATERGSKVHALFRQSHRMKGDAAALGLKNMAAAFERLEGTLTGMHENHSLTGEDFLPVTVQVKSIYEQLDAIESVFAQIGQARVSVSLEPHRVGHDPATAQQPFVQRWNDFAQEIAVRHGNTVELNYCGPDLAVLPDALQDAVNTIVNQFIRNAVVHGIEPAEDRKRLGKPATGRLTIHLAQREDGGVDLSFRDDGRGISVEHVRQVALEKGRLSAEEAATWDPRRIIGLIFEPSVSTRATADGDAGRGVGLDAVREVVARLGGSIRLGTTANEYCRFRVGLGAPAMGSAR